jgi:hypothetical protein
MTTRQTSLSTWFAMDVVGGLPLPKVLKNLTNMFLVYQTVTGGFSFEMKVCMVRRCDLKEGQASSVDVAEGASAKHDDDGERRNRPKGEKNA